MAHYQDFLEKNKIFVEMCKIVDNSASIVSRYAVEMLESLALEDYDATTRILDEIVTLLELEQRKVCLEEGISFVEDEFYYISQEYNNL